MAALGLSRSMWDLLLWCTGFSLAVALQVSTCGSQAELPWSIWCHSSPAGDGISVPCTGRQAQSLDHQRSLSSMVFKVHIFKIIANSNKNYTVHGVLKTRKLKWFVIPFSSGPSFVKGNALVIANTLFQQHKR